MDFWYVVDFPLNVLFCQLLTLNNNTVACVFHVCCKTFPIFMCPLVNQKSKMKGVNIIFGSFLGKHIKTTLIIICTIF